MQKHFDVLKQTQILKTYIIYTKQTSLSETFFTSTYVMYKRTCICVDHLFHIFIELDEKLQSIYMNFTLNKLFVM